MKHTLIVFLILIVSCTNRARTETNKIDQSSNQVSDKVINYDTLRFDLEPDIRLFTAMAFANISGYDYENTVMTSERLDLRSYLDSILPTDYKGKIAGTFKSNNGTTFASVGCKSFNLSLPPNFHWLPDSATLIMPKYQKDEKFAAVLSEFYLKANIPSVWNRYYPNLKKTNYEYAPYTDKAIDDIVKFCGVSESYFDSIKFHFNIFPFMQNESGFTCASKNDIYIIVSPRKTLPGPDAFYHEALHQIINPMVDKNKFLLHKYSQVVNIGKEVRLNAYGFHIDNLFCECMVRTIDYILRERYYNWNQEKIKEEINRQYGFGLTLIPFFYEKLVEFKDTSETLEEYLPKLIQQIDIENEKTRWNNFKTK